MVQATVRRRFAGRNARDGEPAAGRTAASQVPAYHQQHHDQQQQRLDARCLPVRRYTILTPTRGNRHCQLTL